jgi:hypothetical protein
MTINLSGTWQFAIDTADIGIDQNWHARQLTDEVTLPGSMKENHKGFEPALETPWTGSIYDSSWYFNPFTTPYRQPGNLMFPFWLTPNLYYKGAAWYQKEIEIPDNWQGEHIQLFLERPHWETIVWVDNNQVGMQNSLSTAHLFDVTQWLAPGKHRITIRVDNRCKDIKPGPDSSSLTDHTQGNWNGIAGDMYLQATSPVFIVDVDIYPNVAEGNIKVVYAFENREEKTVTVKVQLTVAGKNFFLKKNLYQEVVLDLKPGTETREVILPIGDELHLWDEFSPSLYKLTSKLVTGNRQTDENQATFGMRQFEARGKQFYINGRPVFLRGTLDCAAFPITGYPPTNEEAWKTEFRKAMDYGVNHFRFHSWCPPEAAFEAADELGIYLQPEGPFWTNHGTAVGYGQPVDDYIKQECDRILDDYGNHPSFVMFAYGNEPAGRHQVRFLNDLAEHWMSTDNRRLYTHASIGKSWPLAPSNEYIVRAEARGLPWEKAPQTEFDYGEKIAPYNVPYVAHEMGQFCVFPNFDEIPKYTGVYKAKNFEMFKAELHRKNMGDQAHDFFMASGKFQTICYKNEIEASLRTPNNGGTQLLGLNDFPGQGTALVGVTDVFWDPKAYVTAAEFRRFFNPTVPLARFSRFVFANNDTLHVKAEVAHYGEVPLKDVEPVWTVRDDTGHVVTTGRLTKQDIALGNAALGGINLPLSFAREAARYNLEINVGGHVNDWDFWIYPQDVPQIKQTEVVVAYEFDRSVDSVLNTGGKVLLLAAGKVEHGKNVVQYFRPVFWNTSWFKMRPPHTLGILTNPDHPVFKHFPTRYHSNLQWWELLHRQQVMNLDSFPPDFKPIVQSIDTWFLNRKLGLLYEAKVGKGKIMVCSADIQSDLDRRIVARQLRYSLMTYMLSDEFTPQYEVSADIIKELFEKKDRQGVDFYTADTPDELKPK